MKGSRCDGEIWAAMVIELWFEVFDVLTPLGLSLTSL